jgi:hypothetical protein
MQKWKEGRSRLWDGEIKIYTLAECKTRHTEKKSTHIFGTDFVLLAPDGEILQSEDLEHLALTEMVGFK